MPGDYALLLATNGAMHEAIDSRNAAFAYERRGDTERAAQSWRAFRAMRDAFERLKAMDVARRSPPATARCSAPYAARESKPARTGRKPLACVTHAACEPYDTHAIALARRGWTLEPRCSPMYGGCAWRVTGPAVGHDANELLRAAYHA